MSILGRIRTILGLTKSSEPSKPVSWSTTDDLLFPSKTRNATKMGRFITPQRRLKPATPRRHDTRTISSPPPSVPSSDDDGFLSGAVLGIAAAELLGSSSSDASPSSPDTFSGDSGSFGGGGSSGDW